MHMRDTREATENVDYQYATLISDILSNGVDKQDRTGVGTRSVFGRQLRFDLSEAFPLVRLKRTWFRGVKTELFWLLGLHQNVSEEYAGLSTTNIKYLVDRGVSIWSDWPYKRYCDTYGSLRSAPGTPGGDRPVSVERFEWGISNVDGFADRWGDLGPVYGKQWRDFDGVDQVERAQRMLRKDPDSRRIVVSAWNAGALSRMLLTPCHMSFQFYSAPGPPRTLSCHVDVRSNDVFLGMPFNIASYALLTHIMARATGHEVGTLVYTVGDAHVYSNHLSKSREVVSRQSAMSVDTPPTTLSIDAPCATFEDWAPEDVTVESYDPMPAIDAEVAV